MLKRKFKEVITSIVPITLLVFGLHFSLVPMPHAMLVQFVAGTLAVIAGLTLFLSGVDIGITPLGDLTGKVLAKTNSSVLVLLAGGLLGFLISIAEPGLLVLANQVNQVTSGNVSSWELLIIVSLGLGALLGLGFLRIFYNIPLYKLLLGLYLLIFAWAVFASREFLAIAFDASGSTTGILAVPFILALSTGISRLKKDSKASEKDSFGLVAIASTGPILTILALNILSKTETNSAEFTLEAAKSYGSWAALSQLIGQYTKETALVISPLLGLLLILHFAHLHLKKRELRKLLTGFGLAFLGLLLFMVGIEIGFLNVGTHIGTNLVARDNHWPIILVGFLFGFLTILAEPAVYVLTHQIEQVTSGYLRRASVLIPLSVGVGLAVALSVVRILIPSIQLWHYLLPGYAICLLLMFVIPKMFIGIAFDAGGVATGPITATLIMAFIQGAAHTFEGADLLVDGFGMIAMVAMMPILSLQLLGLVFGRQIKKKEGV